MNILRVAHWGGGSAIYDCLVLLSSSSSSRAGGGGRSSFAGSSLLIGFAGLHSTEGSLFDHVTKMAAGGGWRHLLRRYVDARFRSHAAAADKIFDVVAHN